VGTPWNGEPSGNVQCSEEYALVFLLQATIFEAVTRIGTETRPAAAQSL